MVVYYHERLMGRFYSHSKYDKKGIDAGIKRNVEKFLLKIEDYTHAIVYKLPEDTEYKRFSKAQICKHIK
ncbi:MAG: hypothetical protein C0594_15365 [Marinilabiliales bacterium]|nr:MAG: hypothetical protein C0594_15365 [Marinilabiliales bacterium]